MNSSLLIYGLPCTGKTTAVLELHKKCTFKHISIDNIWKELFHHPLYSIENSNIVFANMLDEVNHLAKRHSNIVIEGMFASKERVIEIERIFINKSLPIKKIMLTASDDTIRNRLSKRKKENDIPYDEILKFKNKISSAQEADYIINTDNLRLQDIVLKILEVCKK